MWHHFILLDSIIFWILFLRETIMLSFLSFILQWLIPDTEFTEFTLASSVVLCPSLVTIFIIFPKVSLTHHRSFILLPLTSNSLVISGKEHILFQHNIFVTVSWAFSNHSVFENVYIIELELQIHNMIPISLFLSPFHWNKALYKYLEIVYSLNCIYDFNWSNV